MSAQGLLLELASRHGIEHGYHDIWGTWHALSTQTAMALLGAMGVDTASEESLAAALQETDAQPWRALAPAVVVVRDGEPCAVALNITAHHDHSTFRWSLECEDGAQLAGEQSCAQLDVLEEDVREDVTVRRRRWLLPDDLPHGYHRLHIALGDVSNVLTLIRTPARCMGLDGARLWGVCLQLYGLRSTSNWGIGDFGDLRTALPVLAAHGADFVGLNPLHALYLDTPSHTSPYSPSSRVYINALYLHVESMSDYAQCAPARAIVMAPGFQARLAALRETDLVDYVGVARCKREVFERLFEHFEDVHLGHGSVRAREFAAFCAAQGAGLRRHALFEALHEHFCHGHSDGNAHSWPAEYRTADGAAVAQFAATHERRIVYFQYLQWQCALQLNACREQARKAGMRVGLYLDLAVGCDGHGADVWSERECYATGVSVGAPADDFALQGQVWGLPPLRADRLREAAYEPFIRYLRANMRDAGALRIDHVLGLLRLFWVPEGGTALDGAYVHYPLNDLLSIAALESERQGCIVVGEDLGTVPDTMRDALARFAVLSYRVFYFEKHWHGDHSFRRPQHYPHEALVTLTTHDLPTLSGYWIGRDLDIRHALALFSSDAFEVQQRETRAHDRGRILKVLRDEGLWPPPDDDASSSTSWQADALLAGELPPPALVEAIYRLLARSNSALLSVQMEDALGVVDQVNVPGTVNEQPNWQRKLPVDIDKWHEHAGFAALCAAISAERPGGAGG